MQIHNARLTRTESTPWALEYRDDAGRDYWFAANASFDATLGQLAIAVEDAVNRATDGHAMISGVVEVWRGSVMIGLLDVKLGTIQYWMAA